MNGRLGLGPGLVLVLGALVGIGARTRADVVGGVISSRRDEAIRGLVAGGVEEVRRSARRARG